MPSPKRVFKWETYNAADQIGQHHNVTPNPSNGIELALKVMWRLIVLWIIISVLVK